MESPALVESRSRRVHRDAGPAADDGPGGAAVGARPHRLPQRCRCAGRGRVPAVDARRKDRESGDGRPATFRRAWLSAALPRARLSLRTRNPIFGCDGSRSIGEPPAAAAPRMSSGRSTPSQSGSAPPNRALQLHRFGHAEQMHHLCRCREHHDVDVARRQRPIRRPERLQILGQRPLYTGTRVTIAPRDLEGRQQVRIGHAVLLNGHARPQRQLARPASSAASSSRQVFGSGAVSQSGIFSSRSTATGFGPRATMRVRGQRRHERRRAVPRTRSTTSSSARVPTPVSSTTRSNSSWMSGRRTPAPRCWIRAAPRASTAPRSAVRRTW